MPMITDKDAVIASQIAYMNVSTEDTYDSGDCYGVPVRELLSKQDGAIADEYIHRVYNGKNPEETVLNQYETMRFGGAKQIIETIQNSRYADWKVRMVEDDNDDSGFYACLIDCGNGRAIVGFRGSEGYDEHQEQVDWIESDIGLLTDIPTRQQDKATEFVEKVIRTYGEQYDGFDLAGHSLGGNLAQHAGITVKPHMRDKIGTIYNLDGPGVSLEYLHRYKEEIVSMAHHVRHSVWSPVGCFLSQLPGASYDSVRTDDRVYGVSADVRNVSGVVWQKHDPIFVLQYMEENETEFFRTGNIDKVFRGVKGLSYEADLYVEGEKRPRLPGYKIDPIRAQVQEVQAILNVFDIKMREKDIRSMDDFAEESIQDRYFWAKYLMFRMLDAGERFIDALDGNVHTETIELKKAPYFEQLSNLKNVSERITFAKGEVHDESKLASFHHLLTVYNKLNDMMMGYSRFLISQADHYRHMGEQMILKERSLMY